MAKWKDLEQALLKHAASYEVSSTTETAEGIHYVVDGKLQTPDGRNPEVRAVWAIDTGSEIPRFITAHPLKRTKGRNND